MKLLSQIYEKLKRVEMWRRDQEIGGARDVIGWWEARRVPFNLIVGSAGILSCIVAGVVGAGRKDRFVD